MYNRIKTAEFCKLIDEIAAVIESGWLVLNNWEKNRLRPFFDSADRVQDSHSVDMFLHAKNHDWLQSLLARKFDQDEMTAEEITGSETSEELKTE